MVERRIYYASTTFTITVIKEGMDLAQTGTTFFNTNAIGGTGTAVVSALVNEKRRWVPRPLSVEYESVTLQVKFTAYTGMEPVATDPSCVASVPNGTATAGLATATAAY
jgi:hypothetical protein